MRYSVYVDERYAFSLSEGALIDAKLYVGQELDTASLDAYKKLSGEDLAYQNSLRYVALRPRSIAEMSDYLQRKHIALPLAQEIIKRLTTSGYLDDEAFARSWVRSRQTLKPRSRRRLVQELRQKRVADEIIERVIQDETGGDLEPLRQIVAKKIQRPPYSYDKQKLIQYLARQGFKYSDIETVMKQSQFDEPTGD